MCNINAGDKMEEKDFYKGQSTGSRKPFD